MVLLFFFPLLFFSFIHSSISFLLLFPFFFLIYILLSGHSRQYRYPKETSKAEKELEEEEKVLKGRAKLRRKYSSKDSRRNPMWRRSRADSGEIEMESLVGSVEC